MTQLNPRDPTLWGGLGAAWAAPALLFCIGLWAGWRLWAANPPRDKFQAGNLLSFLEVIGFGACVRVIGANSLGPYGIGLFFGFFGQVLSAFVQVAASKVRDREWFLDERQLRPMRSVAAGFAPADREGVSATTPLWIRPGDTYKLWLEVGPPVTRADEALQVTAGYSNSSSRLKVALFTFANELQVERGQDVGELDLEVSPSPLACHDSSPSDTEGSTSLRPNQRLAFVVRAPARAGRHRIRCNVYSNDALVQSRVIFVRVRRLPRIVESLLRSIVDRVRELLSRPRLAPSRIDFSQSRALDPHQLAQLGARKLSLMLNDNGDGTHSLRLIGRDFKADATFQPSELQGHIDRLRGSLRQVAWGNKDPWKPEWKPESKYRYFCGDIARLEKDLLDLAVAGYQIYAAIINRFHSEDKRQLTDLMKEPGQVELALKHSASLVLPTAMLYDYPLNSQAPKLRLCDAFRENLASKDISLAKTPCFCGACPNLDDGAVVCPGGFWGFRHSLGMPLSPDTRETAAPEVLRCPFGPRLAVGVSTDPYFTMRVKHETELRQLLLNDGWQYGATRADVLRLLKETRAQVVYFYCHGGVAGENTPFILVGPPGESGITPDNLLYHRVLWIDPRPLVFINGCHTAALEPKAGIDFVSGFVQTAKAAGVIGTEITVFEPLATAFAEDCLRRFIKSRTEIGEAVREARLALLKARNPLGLAYVAYVSPSLRLAPQSPN